VQLTDIDEESLSRLSEGELQELLQAHETLYRAQCRDSIGSYVRSIELPGAPPALSDADKARLAERKVRLDLTVKDDREDEGFDDADDEHLYGHKVDVAEHHELILEAIVGTVEERPIEGPLANGMDGEIADGVMIFCPPGAAKSTYASVAAPSYLLGKYSNFDIIGASYASELAKRFGRRVRHLCKDPGFAQTFETSINEDNQAVDQWSLKNSSSYRAVGIMGGVTGFRANVLIIDDPVAGREEADSDIIREKTWQAYKDDLSTRLKPNGKVVLIQTRWHEDDLAGRLLGETWEGKSGLWRGTDGRLWLVLCLPMVSIHDDDPLGREKGEILWARQEDGTGWFTKKHVEQAKALGERTWGALYQQKPSASDGNIILRKYWRCWPHGKSEIAKDAADPTKDIIETGAYRDVQPPRDLQHVFLCYDTAFEDDEESDYSAMTAWGTFERTIKGRKGEEAKQLNIVMLGAWRAKIDAVDLIDVIKQHVDLFKPDIVCIEKRASGIQLVQEMRRRRFKHTYGNVQVEAWLPPGPPGAKGKRPRAFQTATVMAEGSVWFMPGPTTLAVLKECSAFPNSTYKDWVDTVTMAVLRARNGFQLAIPRDELDEEEEAEREAEELKRRNAPRKLYGSVGGYAQTGRSATNASKPAHGVARRLYGRL
jgi:hypothetical protein